MRQRYELGKTVFKSNQALRLWEAEKGFVEIEEGTLAVPIMLENTSKGYIFHGKGKMVLDAIVETEEGAVGKSVEIELKDLFLMLGDTEKLGEHFVTVDDKDFAGLNYECKEAFLTRAEDLFDRFFEGRSTCCHGHWNRSRGFVFAFENDTEKLDLLVADGSSLVYTAKDVTFVSNRGNDVLKMPDGMLCSHGGKAVFINKGGPSIYRK